MLFITGDTHGQHDFVKLLYFADAHLELTKKDYVIIAGDFGGVWSRAGTGDDALHVCPFALHDAVRGRQS